MDLYLHVAGVGWQNMDLLPEKELPTVSTNALGFARFVGAAYRYFAVQGHGHIAVVSSIAGTKGLGVAPAYSASKAFCNVYIEALEQQARLRHLDIHFTDLRRASSGPTCSVTANTTPCSCRQRAWPGI